MTRIAWGLMILALAALLMVAAARPAAAQEGDDQSATAQMPSDKAMTDEQPGAMTPEATMPDATMPDARMAPAQPGMAGEYPNVAALQPFSPEARYMSVPGYLRWQVFRSQGMWLSYAEARRIVIAQGGRIYRAA